MTGKLEIKKSKYQCITIVKKPILSNIILKLLHHLRGNITLMVQEESFLEYIFFNLSECTMNLFFIFMRKYMVYIELNLPKIFPKKCACVLFVLEH